MNPAALVPFAVLRAVSSARHLRRVQHPASWGPLDSGFPMPPELTRDGSPVASVPNINRADRESLARIYPRKDPIMDQAQRQQAHDELDRFLDSHAATPGAAAAPGAPAALPFNPAKLFEFLTLLAKVWPQFSQLFGGQGAGGAGTGQSP